MILDFAFIFYLLYWPMVRYMYNGEVSIEERDLVQLLATAKAGFTFRAHLPQHLLDKLA